MDILKSNLLISFIIACLFFIIKTLLNKLNKEQEHTIIKKHLFKDSFILFIICYLTLILRNNFLVFKDAKTEVFTNEPSF